MNHLRYQAQFSPDPDLVKLTNGREAHLAGRMHRLGASVVDGAIPFFPASLGALGSLQLASPEPLIIGVVAGFLLLLIEYVMIALNGQSIGRALFGVRITKLDGTPCGFVRGVLLRSVAFGLLKLAANLLLPGVLWVVDVCMISRKDRRTLHDFVAGTVVLRADDVG